MNKEVCEGERTAELGRKLKNINHLHFQRISVYAQCSSNVPYPS